MKRMLHVLAIAFVVFLAACSNDNSETNGKNGEATYVFKLGHVTQESHVWHQTALKFGEELEKLSNGRMKLQIYPASQLGQEKDMVQQLETGSLDFGFLTNAYMSTREQSLNAWFMPFVFSNLEEAAKMRGSAVANEMLKELESQGLIGFDFIFAGNRHVLMKDGFVNSPNDVKGKKIRIIGSPVMQDFWKEIGAGPTAMPLSEVYTSLQTGVIDGVDIDLDALVTEKYYENAKYLTITNQMTFPAVVVMSKQKFDSLSLEDQEIVKKAIQAACDWGVNEAIARETKNLETLKSAGVQVHQLEQLGDFEKVAKKIQEKYANESPVIKKFLEEALQK
ncbi:MULTISPECIES: TRAP transporter substrate-binding protein [Geobacillus]|uniref:C4-dicarboxylate ABC transporter n=1 Tax=Geobacillus thermopakistaniensis (strain MAS1) TaxID=1408282 RepID=A0A7U9P6L9_GEOTM|nr:TRAP transporter substrate-binding protein [Geobacillus sp. MAS1]ESU71759.1 C4-dicarboxylate ABC transporter [Geobacillus sp. MAS1]